MDIRSFDLNFEIMPVKCSSEFARQLEQVLINDLDGCREITFTEKLETGKGKQLIFAIARLILSLLEIN